ncbi:hypothetical protein MtrunA17_Chr7g0226011 [Medicago truncatula]|uniref:Uncharacterized protein n=1 Tax=Medicago truncatula TaxID=3880 RepID=A0A396H2C7_MEDTR|nr:hypothetical protein MtrunA17_Chr7g0226011 [Medicago truncatula]
MNVASSIVFHEWTVKRSLKSYRIIVAFLTVLEKFSNVVIGWLPMYELKLALFIFMWYPKTKVRT